jgi:hypothetical protein
VLDAGINWIDTAAVYGLGHSEEVVARARSPKEKALTTNPVGRTLDNVRMTGAHSRVPSPASLS